MGFMEDYEISYDLINKLLTENPSFRSFGLGYAAEGKLRELHLDNNPEVTEVEKYDDHDRTKKGDLAFRYRGYQFTVEVKSIQNVSMVPQKRSGIIKPVFQCDASDRRLVKFADGTTLQTTNLLVGEFDLVAVNLFAFENKWKFVFAANSDLPTVRNVRGAAQKYTEYQMDNLLMGSMPMTNPPSEPYEEIPWNILDRMVEKKIRAGLLPGN